jgi:hypothetical protein
MQRVATFDVIRGVAIFAVVPFHVFFFLYQSSVWELRSDLSNTSNSTFIKLAIMFYFAGWGGIFLMISAAANSYVFLKRLERGFPMRDVFRKQLMSGAVLLILAIILDIFFDVDGILVRSIEASIENRGLHISWNRIRIRWMLISNLSKRKKGQSQICYTDLCKFDNSSLSNYSNFEEFNRVKV